MAATVEEVLAFADRWLPAWNSHDTDQVLALLHVDVLWEDEVFWTGPIRGREGVRTYVEAIWQAMPDVSFEEVERFVSPGSGRGVVLFRQSGAAPAGFEGHPGFSAHGCDIFLEFRDGLLAHYLAAYDIVGMMQQMEMIPPRGGRLGGSYLRALAGASRRR